jgi:hypothetical protein
VPKVEAVVYPPGANGKATNKLLDGKDSPAHKAGSDVFGYSFIPQSRKTMHASLGASLGG